MSKLGLVARFIEGGRGRLFTLLRRPATVVRKSVVLVIPPFGEEMNKCRRMLTLTAQGLAAEGCSSVIPDLHGTGDSEGEFGEADWNGWCADVQGVAQSLEAEGWSISGLLGIRTGCLLAAHVAGARGAQLVATVFWQPVVSGQRFLNQFLRLRVAASMMGSGPRETAAELRAQLKGGRAIEVAGYELNGQLAAQLEQLDLGNMLSAQLGELHWMEVGHDPKQDLPQSSIHCIERYRALGKSVHVHRCAGEPFWASTEIVVNRALISDTVAALAGTVHAQIN